MANLSGIIEQLKTERDEAAATVERLDVAIRTLSGTQNGTGTRHAGGVSAAARARMSAAQRARWARVRQNGQQKKDGRVVSMPRRRTMSAAARRKIAEAQRARWAKIKAGHKKAA